MCGFTIIELLTVIAIILVLASLLLPAVDALRGQAMVVRCKAVVKTFGTAALIYASDREGRLPAMSSAGGYYGPPPHDRGWLGSEVSNAVPALSGDSDFLRPGSLQDYIQAPIDHGKSFYRCPLLPQTPLGSAKPDVFPYGSNGAFDYTMFSYANGAPLSVMPRFASVRMPDALGNPTTNITTIPAPIFTEEDPRYGNNNNFIDPDHTSINRDGVWHYRGACMYFCVDGSVQQVVYATSIGPEAQAWTAADMTGRVWNIGQMGTWDIWRRRVQGQ